MRAKTPISLLASGSDGVKASQTLLEPPQGYLRVKMMTQRVETPL